MAIHGLCIVKNEADIIEQTLRAASRWCDHIYVFDNGSDDGTWELIQALAGELPAVVPFKQDPLPFTDALRGQIFRAYKHRAEEGDWWCVLDADEFYIDDPRLFLAAVPTRYRAVWPAVYTFLFTEQEAEAYRVDPSHYGAAVPIADKLHHYVLNDYSELRFFRHDPALADRAPADLPRSDPAAALRLSLAGPDRDTPADPARADGARRVRP
jgi:glycosyltransferase involved in cell wall biosynthesis